MDPSLRNCLGPRGVFSICNAESVSRGLFCRSWSLFSAVMAVLKTNCLLSVYLTIIVPCLASLTIALVDIHCQDAVSPLACPSVYLRSLNGARACSQCFPGNRDVGTRPQVQDVTAQTREGAKEFEGGGGGGGGGGKEQKSEWKKKTPLVMNLSKSRQVSTVPVASSDRFNRMNSFVFIF